MQGPWSGTYSSSQPAVASATAGVNCRAIYCLTAGTITYQQGPLGALGPATAVPLALGQTFPVELNGGLITSLGGGTYLLLA
jgi:hypothetical protein